MFDFVRKHTRIMQILLFLLIMPSFVLFGIEGYSRFSEKGEQVAQVAGDPISKTTLEEAHRAEVDRLRATMPQLDPQLLESPQAMYGTLERMVRDRLLASAARELHLTASNQRLAAELQRNEVIQSLRKPDGSLDMDRYRQLLAAQGLSPEMFEARMRAELSSQQVISAIAQSSVATRANADIALASFLERRTVQMATFDPAPYMSRVTPSAEQLEQYYKAHQQEFLSPEQATVEYVVLDLETVKKGIVVSEAELRAHYEQNAPRMGAPEERRASHVLIAVSAKATAQDRQEAKSKAQALQVALAKSPKSFAEVARKQSQDPGSASQGGDLGFFARGAMAKPFEDAAFAMKKGDISPVVETEFGYHVIALTDVKAPKVRSFEDVRRELEADVRKQQAQKKFAEYAETFSNLVYERSDSLKPAAEKLKLEIRSAAGVSRQAGQGLPTALANPKFLNALFTPDTIEKGRNTQAIELASNMLVAGRLSRYAAARTQPLDEVKDKVRTAAQRQQAIELARDEGQRALANGAAAKFGAATEVSRLDRKGMPMDVVLAAMRADASKLPVLVGVDMGTRGYALVRVTQVMVPSIDAGNGLDAGRAQYGQWWGAAEMNAYYNALKEQFKTTIKLPRPGGETASR
jgi:peptidyl-prolyl cis-trans isomerase D